jgi:hypothetical protein
MANASKRKGDQFERDVRDYLNAVGVYSSRIPAGATSDHGDLWLPPPGPVVQCKNHARIDLAGWVDEMTVQAENAGRGYGVVVAKRKGRGVEHAYVITSLALGWPLLKEDA